MSVKEYGIYIAYPPMVDLKKEGLGRYLAMFLKGAGEREDLSFTIVCPSWSREALAELFESERISADLFTICTPQGEPYALKFFERLHRRKKNRRGRWLLNFVQKARALSLGFWGNIASQAVQVHSLSALLIFLASTGLKGLIAIILGLFIVPVVTVAAVVTYFLKKISRSKIYHRIISVLVPTSANGLAMHLFDEMHRAELDRMQNIIGQLSDVRAWYCPVAFWPSFHDIDKPRLICIPDVWPTDFPVGFSSHGDRLKLIVERVNESIYRADHLVTYSNEIKWSTLVDHYGINPNKVSVIHHAPNRMDGFNSTRPPNPGLSLKYCQNLLLSAIRRSVNQKYTGSFQNSKVDYIFYASQFRPNKNVLTLLRAYVHLLREKHISHKLFLTGNGEAADVKEFVTRHRLQNDVLFLHGLSTSELAACYQLADLAVNPSFAEGGCPFTFTEALSVGTPVVMARIPVTEEVLTDPDLQQVTLFDPYSWQDCANRIEWGLQHREELLEVQNKAFEQLSRRTWTDVVNEHVAILDRISQP
ncbi:glycosyltransferase [Comamonas sp. JNW]|uniref:glycosyltransferase n=1 Tax=Comamonas sp. JNW TaxID=2170731 RepID=UPI000DE6DCFE|nr:glycosyltransferase [Comamonas sp. JNW]PWB19227.1 glycoside hydrolase [Comamonas sp. JNW]